MNTKSPNVSIVIPVYNLEFFLEKCLNSLINQTYKNLEIIVVDDGSTDETVSIINEYLNKDSRLKLHKINHHGAASARKVGILNASGPFITFVDGDDHLELDAIEILLKEIIKNDCDIVIGKHKKIYLNNSQSTLQHDYPFNLIDQISFSDFIHLKKDYTLWGKMFRLDLFDDINFHEGIPIGEDGLVLNQVILKANIIKAINKVIYNYVIHADSISHKIYSKINSQLLYIKGSLDNVSIFAPPKQQSELSRIFGELLEYNNYYLKMSADEKKLFNSIWLNYYNNKIISDVVKNNLLLKFKFWISNSSPKFYSFVQMGRIYFALSINILKVKIKKYSNYTFLLKSLTVK